MGLPPMYFEIFWSRGSNVGFIETAPAGSHGVKVKLPRRPRNPTFREFLHESIEPLTSGSIRVQILVPFVPGCLKSDQRVDRGE